MNAIFALLFFASAAACVITDPEGFLPALLAGGQKAVTLTLTLLASYSVWLAFFEVVKACGIDEKLTRLFYPLARRLFRSEDREALYLATSNLSANLLGLPGAPTPLGVKATEKFLRAKNGYAAEMLFVVNATSLQLLPTTVIALRTLYGSPSPQDVLLPTLLSTLLSTLTGVLLVFLSHPKRRRK